MKANLDLLSLRLERDAENGQRAIIGEFDVMFNHPKGPTRLRYSTVTPKRPDLYDDPVSAWEEGVVDCLNALAAMVLQAQEEKREGGV